MLVLSKVIKQYIENCKYMKGLNDKSIKAYSIDLNQFEKWCTGNTAWDTKQNLEDYIKHLYKNFKPRSAKRKIASIKAFFNYLETEEIIQINPFHKIKYKRRESLILPRSIPINTLSNLLNSAYKNLENNTHNNYQSKNAIRDIAVMELLFASGVRVSELCSLQKEDVDIKNKIIKVSGKGSKERYIQITNKSVLSILKDYQKLFSSEINTCGFYFINNRGRRLTDQSVRHLVDKYAKRCNAEIHITPHMFRHTIATLLLEEDVDIRYIQELLGHSFLSQQLKYTHTLVFPHRKKFLHKSIPATKSK